MITILVGSRLYGAALPTSDWDYLRIGPEPTAHLPWPTFIALAQGGDPLMVQALFSPYVTGDPEDLLVLPVLRALLPRPAMCAGLWARAHANLLDGRPRQRFHAVRLLLELFDLLASGTITYPLTHRALLTAFRPS
jgi:hypothetical protein